MQKAGPRGCRKYPGLSDLTYAKLNLLGSCCRRTRLQKSEFRDGHLRQFVSPIQGRWSLPPNRKSLLREGVAPWRVNGGNRRTVNDDDGQFVYAIALT